jgi:hypothetical protein
MQDIKLNFVAGFCGPWAGDTADPADDRCGGCAKIIASSK